MRLLLECSRVSFNFIKVPQIEAFQVELLALLV